MNKSSTPSGEALQTEPSGSGGGNLSGKNRFKSKYVLGALIVILAIIAGSVRPQKNVPPDSMVWLTATEAAEALQPGKLTGLQWKIVGMSKTTWSWFTKSRKSISINSEFLTIPDEVVALRELASSVSWTNANGMRGWILSPEEWMYLRIQLPISLQAAQAGETRMQMITLDGFQSVNSTTVRGGTGTNLGAPVAYYKSQVLTKVAHGKIQLLLQATATEPASTNGVVGTRTNFAMAGRVVLPNGGALIVDGRKRGDAPGTNYWFITSVIAVDPAGNPVKLGK